MPTTPVVLSMANERADRWMRRYDEAMKEVARLSSLLDELTEGVA